MNVLSLQTRPCPLEQRDPDEGQAETRERESR